MARAVAIVLKGYPRLSETFIANEIRGLERRGLDVRIISLRHPTDRDTHPVHGEIEAPVTYLPEYLHREPLRVWRGWRRVGRRPGYPEARRQFLRDLRRDRTPNRLRRFGQALVLAAELPDDVGALHAHFLHTPSSVTGYAATILGLPWSASAHAKDIWTTPGWELAEKIDHCEWVTTCSAVARDWLQAVATEPDKISLAYHGLDQARFPPRPGIRPGRDGADPDDPIRILAVGRAVEKKGLDVLIEALAGLPNSLHWRLTHIGGGHLADTLRRQAEARGLAGRIDWRGALPQDKVLKALREADLFVLPSRIARDGDRDGLPNVLLEAQSQALSCIAADVSAVSELIVDGATGLLVAPDDARALAVAIENLARNPVRRLGLGRAGENRVRAEFSFEDGLDRLAAKFGLTPPLGDETRCELHSMPR